MTIKNEFVAVRLVVDRVDFADPTYGSGVVWSGKGNVQPVPNEKWAAMKKHTDVWQEADASTAAEEDARTPALNAEIGTEQAFADPSPSVDLAVNGSGGLEAIEDLSDSQLLALVKSSGLRVDSRLRGEKLRDAVVKAHQAQQAA